MPIHGAEMVSKNQTTARYVTQKPFANTLVPFDARLIISQSLLQTIPS
jgi:hypothetical protein